jgi:hypothetical protein
LHFATCLAWPILLINLRQWEGYFGQRLRMHGIV